LRAAGRHFRSIPLPRADALAAPRVDFGFVPSGRYLVAISCWNSHDPQVLVAASLHDSAIAVQVFPF